MSLTIVIYERRIKLKTLLLQLILIILMFLSGGCAGPQYFWPQKDIFPYEINQSTLEQKVLISSRESEFKTSIIQRIIDAFRDKNVYIKIIGIEDLKYEDANLFSAVVIINTSMAWQIDRKVEAFLNRFGRSNSIIVLTTSQGGDILPELNNLNIDAISSASKKVAIMPVSDKIILKLQNILKGKAQ